MKLLAWALYRPRNVIGLLVGSMTVLFATSIAMSIIVPPEPVDPAEQAAAGTIEFAEPPEGWMSGDTGADDALHDHEAGAAMHDAARERAQGFTDAWVRTGPKWVKGLRAHVAEGLIPYLAFYDQTTIPRAHRRVVMEDVTEYGGTARARLSDGSVLTMTLSWDGLEWLVVDYGVEGGQ